MLDALDLLLQLRCGTPLGGLHVFLPISSRARRRVRGDLRQERYRHAAPSDLVRGDHLLGELQGLGELHLREALILTQGGNAAAELLKNSFSSWVMGVPEPGLITMIGSIT